MGTWQDGYVTDIPYTAGFYRELSPSYLHLLGVLMGVRPPAVVEREFSYCELGCGQGLGTLLLAAANPLGTFHGFDFNPAQIAKANDLADRAGLRNVRFTEESFAGLAGRGAGDDTRYDLIVLHGIYSWVSEANRRHIVHIIRDRLKPGGMVYVSYNCMPGWGAFAPVQRLMREFVARRHGRSDQNVVVALDFVNQLVARGARYFQVNESVVQHLERLGDKDRTYLAHEYLNEHWVALYHVDVAREMEEARLEFVGSATISDNILALSAPSEIADMLKGADLGMAETVKDFAVNRRFRRDLFVRGPGRLSPAQFVHALGEIRFMLTIEPERATTTLVTSAGELTSNQALVQPVLDRLKQGPAGFAEIAALPAFAELQPWRVAQTLSLIVESGQAHPMREDAAARATSQALNAVLIEASRHDDSMQFLASPVLGSGVFVSHPEQLVLLAMRELGSDRVADLRDFVWARFKAQNKRLVKDGRPLDGDTDNLAQLERRVVDFFARRLPMLRRLGVAGDPGPDST